MSNRLTATLGLLVAASCLLVGTPSASAKPPAKPASASLPDDNLLAVQPTGFSWTAKGTKTQKINAKNQLFRVYVHPVGIEVLTPDGSLVTPDGDQLSIKKPGCACEYVVIAYRSGQAALEGGSAFIRQAESQLKRVPDLYSPSELAKARNELSSGRPVYFNDWIPGNDAIGCRATGDATHGYFYYCHNHFSSVSGASATSHFAPGGLEINLQ